MDKDRLVINVDDTDENSDWIKHVERMNDEEKRRKNNSSNEDK
jgi:hypothetical protein